MRKEKHIEALLGLLKDVQKEPSPAVVGFIYSTALTHMFHLAFYDHIDPGRAIKHEGFRSKKKSEALKQLIPDFEDKDKLFLEWQDMENKRNALCYGHPEKEDIESYIGSYFLIKNILEKQAGFSFEVTQLENLLPEEKKDE